MITFKKSLRCFLFTGLIIGNLQSCSWREFGCAAGSIAGQIGAQAWIHQYNKEREREHKPTISGANQQAIIACATALGCIIGSELVGCTAEYVSIKRAEYQAEAEQLAKDIERLDKAMSDTDNQLAWMNGQASELKKQASNVKKLPVGREYMAGELQKAVVKRKADVETIQKNLRVAREDAAFLRSVSTDQAQKQALQQKIKEIDERIATTRQVRDNILAANASVSYI